MTTSQLETGTILEPIEIGPLSRTDFVRYAGASGDFNPVHHDEEFARASGHPTVFGHGMLAAGVLARVVTRAVGREGLRRFRVRFLARIWPGDVVRCEGRITRRYESEEKHLVDGELSARNQRGETVVTGSFTALVPS